jgi:hypothetical protein
MRRTFWDTFQRLLACGTLVLTAIAATPVKAQFGELLNKVPQDANVLVMVDLTKILGSEISSQEQWAKKIAELQQQGVSHIPRGASSYVVAAQMDLDFKQSIWESTLIRFAGGAPSIKDVAAKFGTKPERLSGHDTARLPDDSIAVAFDERVLGAYLPGNRQEVSRWLKEVDSPNNRGVSPYLRRAEGYAVEVGTPIVMTIDLTGGLSKEQIADRLANFKTLEGKTYDADQVASILSSIEGVTLGATVGEKINASIRVDFTADITPLGDVIVELLWEVLAREHAMLEEFPQFKSKVSAHTVQVSGTLSSASLRQLLMLLTAAPALGDALRKDATELVATDDETKVREASKAYFSAIDETLDDLIGKRGTGQMKTFGQVGLWFQNAARQLERRSTLNVDPDLVAWGQQMISAMRDTSNVLRGVGMQSSVAQSQVSGNFAPAAGGTGYGPSYGYGYGYGSAYGMGGAVPGLSAGYRAAWNAEAWREDLKQVDAQRRAIRTQLKVQGASNAQQIVRQMEESRAQERQRLTQKFGVEF